MLAMKQITLLCICCTMSFYHNKHWICLINYITFITYILDIENEDMIECAGQQHCNNGRWFHATCMNIESVADYEGRDWCCEDKKCHKNTSCKLNTKRSKFIECNSKENCKKGRRFHLSCVKLKRRPG